MANPFFSDYELKRLRERSSALDPTDSRREHDWEWFRRQERPLYLWGCGGLAPWIREKLGGLDLRGYLDNDPGKWGTVVDGLPVLSPVDKGAIARDALVVIALAKAKHVSEVTEQCRLIGLSWVDCGDCWPAFDTRATLEELAENEDAIGVVDLWADAESRKVYRDIIRFRTTFDLHDAPDMTEPQYFIPEVPRAAYSRFVDAGAFDGDTLRDYLLCYRDVMEAYYAFEPIAAAAERIAAAAAMDKRIDIFRQGVSGFSGKARMKALGTSSSLKEDGGAEIDVVCLDDVLENKSVSFIKMDIEGEEPEALKGAEKLIRRNRPLLGISVYHKPEHLWRVPRWIADLDMGYRMLLRHHSRFPTETVCYALPE